MVELVCPAGTPAALRTAVEAGADAVYIGFNDETNARNFPGLNFDRTELEEAITYAHGRGAKVLLAVNTFPRAGATRTWRMAIDDAARLGADAVIVADIGLADYCARTHPELRLHLSVQAAASTPEAIGLYVKEFGVKRVVLPRVLSVAEIAELNGAISCETEVFVFGGLCVMAEGRCQLSSYVTGKSPNMHGVCSPASHVSYQPGDAGLDSKLGGFTINRFSQDEKAGYPTLCKGRFSLGDQPSYVFEDPVSLNASELLGQLVSAGVTALKIEGRQRSRAYVRSVVSDLRQGLDALTPDGRSGTVSLAALSEGQAETRGAYERTWR